MKNLEVIEVVVKTEYTYDFELLVEDPRRFVVDGKEVKIDAELIPKSGKFSRTYYYALPVGSVPDGVQPVYDEAKNRASVDILSNAQFNTLVFSDAPFKNVTVTRQEVFTKSTIPHVRYVGGE